MVIKIEKRRIKYFLAVFAALILGFMFHLDQSANMDFNRWQEMMDAVRNSKMSLSDFLADNTHMLKWMNITLPYMYSFNTLLYFISRHFSNNYVMVWVSVLIDYTIIAYIAFDWRRESKYSQMEVLLSFLICFAFLPVIHVCSGLRAATSACFMALAVYNYLYRDNGIINFILFAGISITFHPITAFAIPIALVIKLTSKRIIFYITVLGCLFISRIADIFTRSGIDFLRTLATKYASYTSDRQFRAYRFAMYGVIVIATLVIIYYLIVYQKSASEKRSAILNILSSSRHAKADKERLFLFLSSYLALLVGNAGSYEIVCRGGYIIGAFAPILTDLLLGTKNASNKNVAVMIKLAVVVLLLYMCLSWIRYYYPYFI